jgi:phosphatidylserine/phosphatidylglycerophosphate/cardiolipin synthase-like enzyme
VLGALRTAGVLKASTDGAFVIDPDRYSTSITWRVAALEALSWAAAAPNELGECELLVATPADAQNVVAEAYQRQFSDLRTTVRTIVASTKHRVLLAAPYWDVQVATDLAEILRRRKDAGVSVAILARQPHTGSTNERALAVLRDALPESSSCQIRILEHPSAGDPFGWSTFHFKAACADGMHAYLGSANFNTAGLASRWELGVKLGGRRARTIAELLEALFAASRPF